MKKMLNYLAIKINFNKIRLIIIVACIYQFLIYLDMLFGRYRFNFYDIIIEQFGYLNLFYFISFCFLLILYNLCNNNTFNEYVCVRLNSKYKVYNMNMVAILLMSIFLTIFFDFIAVLECIGRISFNNKWSEYFHRNMTGNVNLFFSEENTQLITTKLTPLNYVVFTNNLVILYLLFIGSLFFVINLYIRKRAISFIISIIILALNLFVGSSNSIIGKLSFTQNIFFITSSYQDFQSNNYILYKYLYWVILNLITYLLGLALMRKYDYEFEELI